ncbi:unnamed protein product, partial [Mesorhabditis spiculigera]
MISKCRLLPILPAHPSTGMSFVDSSVCPIQAGVLRCFVNNDVRLKPGNEQTLHRIVITPGSRVAPCNLDDSVVLLIEPTTDSPMLQYILTCDSKHIADSWAKAIEHQLNDAIIWGEFAYVHTRLSLNRPREAIDGTIPRDRSSRLYDTINISGSLSKAFMGSTGYNSGLPIGLRKALADQNGGARTAPAPKKNRIRTNVKEIFKDQPLPEEPQQDVREPLPTESARNSRYIINLSVGDDVPLQKVSSSKGMSGASTSHAGKSWWKS